MMNWKIALPCLVPAFLLTLASCDDKHTDVILQPPILIREMAPGDSAVVTDDGDWPLRIELRAPIEEGELNLWIYPEPDYLSPGRLTASGRTLVFDEVDLADGNLKHRLLIDGVRFPKPKVIEYVVGDPPIALFEGRIQSSNPSKLDVDEAVVFIYDDTANIDPFAPESILAATPIGLARIPPRKEGEIDAPFVATALENLKYYQVVAIGDTNDDGLFDPNTDWWGYHHEEGDLGSALLQARACVPCAYDRADILIGPPGAVSPR